MKTYPEYKDSNLPWLGKIPKHWEILPNRSLFEERKIQNTENEELLSVTITKGVIKQTELLQNSSKKDISNLDKTKYKLVVPGDIAYNKMRMWQGAVGMSKYRGIVSPAYIVLRVRQDVYPEYYHFLFRTPQYTGESYRYSYGICDDQLSLRYEDFKTINSPLPPLEEQKQIVKFLNHKCSKIAKFIRNKRRLIELLNEKKQAIINQAVTRGINSDVRLKPSGVDYLGDIPEHWEVIKLKYIARFNPSKSEIEKDYLPNQEVVFLPMEKVSVDGVIDCSEKRKLSEVWNGFTYFRRNDVIIAKITPCFENRKGAFLCELETDFGFGTTEFIVMRPSKKINGRFLYFVTANSKFRLYGAEFMTGSAGQKRISTDFVKDFKIALPPLEEQKKIHEYLDQYFIDTDTSIEKIKKEINLIREYRNRLIYDAVTGKIDVRDTAVESVEGEQIYEELDIEDTKEMQEEVEVLRENVDENI